MASTILSDLKEDMNALSLSIADTESRLLAIEEEASQLRAARVRYINEYQKVLSKLTVYNSILIEIKELEKPKKLSSVEPEDRHLQEVPKKLRNNGVTNN